MGGNRAWYQWLYRELFGASAEEATSYRFVENLSEDDSFKAEKLGDFASWQAMARAQQSDGNIRL